MLLMIGLRNDDEDDDKNSLRFFNFLTMYIYMFMWLYRCMYKLLVLILAHEMCQHWWWWWLFRIYYVWLTLRPHWIWILFENLFENVIFVFEMNECLSFFFFFLHFFTSIQWVILMLFLNSYHQKIVIRSC